MPPVTFNLNDGSSAAAPPTGGGGGPVTFDLNDGAGGTGGTSGTTLAPQAGYEPTGGLGGWARKNLEGVGGPAGWENPQAGGLLAGATMSGGRGAATLLDLISDPLTKTEQIATPGSVADKALQAMKGGKIEQIAQRMKSTADWLKTGSKPQGFWEQVGALGEQALEYYLPSHYLELVGPAAKATQAVEATEAATGAARSAEQLKNAQQVNATLAKNPKLAGLVAIGLEQGSLQGAQTYLHTEDLNQAAEAGVVGGTLGAGAGALAEGARYLKGVGVAGEAERAAAAAEEAARNRTTTIDVGGTPVTVLPSQITPEGGLSGVTATGEGRQDVAEMQQHNLQTILQNKAQTSLAGVLDRANQTRALQFEPAAEPQYFKVGEGENASWAQKKVPASVTKNPSEAEAWLYDLERRMRDPNVSESTWTQLNDMHQSLENQLGIARASSQAAPIDIQSAVQNARDFGDAGAQAHGAARDIYQMMDKQTGGEFNRLRQAEKDALATISDHQASNEAVSRAQDDLEGIQSKIQGLFSTARINPNDVQAARELYRDGLVYNQLHATVERMANGITLGDTESGLKRVVSGNNKLFDNFLSKGNNRKLVSNLIGEEGIADLKTMFQLTSDANIARKTAEVVENVANEGSKQGFRNLLARYGKPGEALILANAYAHPLGAATAALGLGYGKGAMIGSGIGLTHFLSKQIVESAASNGRVINMIDFAVRNNVDPRIYAPLISRALMTPMQEPQKPEQQPQLKPQGGTE